jgi:hypothetical protein
LFLKSLNNFHVAIYPWLGGVYQGGGGGVRRNIKNVSVTFVFPKLKRKYRSYLIIYISRKEDAVQIWIHINEQHTNFQFGELWIVNGNK